MSLAGTHFLASAGLALTALVIRLRIDTSHPIFAIVHHEVKILLGLSLVLSVMLLALFNDHLLLWYKLGTFTTFVALSLHQVSWLAITHLRYKLLVTMSPGEVEEIDLGKMRKQFTLLVQVGSVMSLIFCIIFWVAVLVPHGKALEDVEQNTRLTARMGSMLVSNLPDYISVIYYVKMWLHFKPPHTSGNSVAPSMPEADQESSHQGQDSVSTNALPDDPTADLSATRRKSAMRTLKSHVILALMDILVEPLALFIKGKRCKFFFLAYCNAVVGFWLPLVVITRDFNQINGVNLGEVVKEIFGVWV